MRFLGGAEGEGFEPSRDETAPNGFETSNIWLSHAPSGPVRDTTRDSWLPTDHWRAGDQNGAGLAEIPNLRR
jgi:hypothetical protein